MAVTPDRVSSAMPTSIDGTLELLSGGNYVGDRSLATVLFLALKMGRPIRRNPVEIALCVIAFVAIGLLRYPLPWVLAVLVPISVAIAWRSAR